MKKFFNWLFLKLGFVPRSMYDGLSRIYADEHEELRSAQALLEIKTKDLNDLKARCDKMCLTSMEELLAQNSKLKLDNDRVKHDMEECEKYYKTVQTAVEKALNSTDTFKFTHSYAFPGATTINDTESTEGEVTIVGRTVMMDETTTKIQHVAGINDKYNLAVAEMVKYGVVDKIAQYILRSGALQMTLAYNTDCTALEAYYTITCHRPDTILTIEGPKKK